MNYTLAVFKSRYATLNFANLLRANNVPAAIINTPHSIGSVCGISVKFLNDFYPKVQALMSYNPPNNFVGFYSLNGRTGNIFRC